MIQSTLFENRLDQLFAEYHARNPQVFELFRKFSEQVRETGHKHFGAKAIMERIRWEVAIKTSESDGFKVNNNFTSRYVRLLERERPEFVGLFRKRKLKGGSGE